MCEVSGVKLKRAVSELMKDELSGGEAEGCVVRS